MTGNCITVSSKTFRKADQKHSDIKIRFQLTTDNYNKIPHYFVLDYSHNLLVLLHVSVMLNIKAYCKTWFSVALAISCGTIITCMVMVCCQKQTQWGDVVKKLKITSTSPVIRKASHHSHQLVRGLLSARQFHQIASYWILFRLETQWT